MKILLKTTRTHPEYDGDCGCAVLDLTPERLARVAARVAVAHQAAEDCEDLWELYFWGGRPSFHDRALIDACAEAAASAKGTGAGDWEGRLDERGFLPVPEGVDLERFEARRTECDHYVANTVMWRPTGPAG